MRIFGVFLSIDGEVNSHYQGRFTVFIRLAGCNFFKYKGCNYCDTKYAQDPNSGTEMPVEEVMKKVESFGCKKVTITGRL